jgi:NADH-quinone oxidoreductase subunit M
MLNHGVSTGALFLLIGMIYDRRHTHLISEFGGLAIPAPVLSSVFLYVTFSSVGLPLLNSFVGEFLILYGASQASIAYAAYASTAVILSAVYMLWMYQRVFLGVVTNPVNETMPDMSAREKWVIAPLLAMALYMGVASPQFFKPMEKSTEKVIPVLVQKVMLQEAPR